MIPRLAGKVVVVLVVVEEVTEDGGPAIGAAVVGGALVGTLFGAAPVPAVESGASLCAGFVAGLFSRLLFFFLSDPAWVGSFALVDLVRWPPASWASSAPSPLARSRDAALLLPAPLRTDS